MNGAEGARGAASARLTVGRWTPRPQLPLLLVLALVLPLYAWGLTRGLPVSWDQDEITPRDLLDSLDRGVAVGWPKRYPPLQYWLLAAPAARVRAAGLLPDGQDRALFLLIRGTSLLMALGIVAFAYLAARQLFDRRAALLAAAAAALVQPMVYYAKVGNLDVPYTFWFAASLWLYLRLLAGQRRRDYALFAATATLAVCTKDQAYGLYTLAPAALLVFLGREDRARGRRRSLARRCLDRRILLAGAVAGLVFVAVQVLPEGLTPLLEHLREITGPFTKEGQQFPATLAGQGKMLLHAARHVHYSLGTTLLAAALLGIVLALGRRAGRGLAVAALLPIPAYYLSFVAVILYHWDRYFLPVCTVLSLFAGHGLAWLSRLPRARGVARAGLVGALLGFAVLRAVTLDLVLVNDSRTFIERWAQQRATVAEGAGAVAVGTPENRQLPRLNRIPWRRVWSTAGEHLGAIGAEVVVINVTDALYAGQPREVRQVYSHLLAGDYDYVHLFHYRYHPPLLFPESFYHCWSDIHSNLCLANPLLAVFGRRRPETLVRHLVAAAGDPERLLRVAAHEREIRRFDRAEILDGEARCLAPFDARAAHGLGLDAAGSGRDEQALGWLREAVALAPDREAARLDLALALLRSGRIREARDEAAAAATLSGSPQAWLVLAQVEAAAGRRTGVVHAVREAAEGALRSGHEQALGEAIGRLLDAQAWSEAARLLGRARIHPGAGDSAALADLERDLDARRRPMLGGRSAGGPLLRPAALGEGFYGREASPTGPYHWTAPCAMAEIEDGGGDSVLVLRYRCGPLGGEIRLRAGAQPSPGRRCQPWEVGEIQVPLPRPAWQDSHFLPVEITVDPPWLPGDRPGSADPRTLGVQVFALGLEIPAH